MHYPVVEHRIPNLLGEREAEVAKIAMASAVESPNLGTTEEKLLRLAFRKVGGERVAAPTPDAHAQAMDIAERNHRTQPINEKGGRKGGRINRHWPPSTIF
mmetsp:Transcript_26730/g.64785  ORF Transcript_26730/g.64785 Transcript_26730/m.64785 type:complete len:101 (-) Transcript_26730:189-491(-)